MESDPGTASGSGRLSGSGRTEKQRWGFLGLYSVSSSSCLRQATTLSGSMKGGGEVEVPDEGMSREKQREELIGDSPNQGKKGIGLVETTAGLPENLKEVVGRLRRRRKRGAASTGSELGLGGTKPIG